MPAYSTHYIFALEMMPFIRKTADFEVNEAAVLYGTQGPDIFFFHRVFPWMAGKSLRKIGSMLHRARPAEILENMRAYCNNLSDNQSVAKSYVYGFILHYALDRRCHPYVYSLQNKMVDENKFMNSHTAHNLIELGMDAYLLTKRLRVENQVRFNTAETLTDDKKVKKEAGRLYEYTLQKVLQKTVPASKIEVALDDTVRVQSATHDSTGVKRIIVTVLESIIAPFSKNYKFSAMIRPRHLEKAKKYANIYNSKWKSPFDSRTHTESFEDLFELAKQDAEQLITAFQAGASTREITNNISFLTGVEVK